MTSRFDIVETSIPAVKIIQRRPIGDDRGYLERMFCLEELRPFTSGKEIVQINHSLTARRGAIRGMHFQYPPHSEIKLVSCVRGEVFDVAVDLRPDSPTFLHWHAEILSAVNHRSLLIPEGFAHGFQTLTENCELLYFHTAAWHKESEGGLNSQDARLCIHWPEPLTELSPRDAGHPLLTEKFAGVVL